MLEKEGLLRFCLSRELRAVEGGGGWGEELVHVPGFRFEQKVPCPDDCLLLKPGNTRSGFTRTKFQTPLKVLISIS